MKLSDPANAVANNGGSPSSDEGNSAMISDGDRSDDSSPPWAGEMMSIVIEEKTEEAVATSLQPNQELRPKPPSEFFLPAAGQLVALASMHPPSDRRVRVATMDSSIEQELSKPSAKTTTNNEEHSPHSYKYLEELSSSTGSSSRYHGAESGQQPSTDHDVHPTRSSDDEHPTPKNAPPLPESEIAPLEMITVKDSPKLEGSKVKQGASLRRGKWTVEEEAYVARVIQDFNSGFLDAPAGTTLRTYLSEKLKCDPMRITKKFTGDACIGKRVFHPAVRSLSNTTAIDQAQAELDTLERRWRRRLEMQQRESAKKAAASVAVAAAASSGRTLSPGTDKAADNTQQLNPVAQTAAWLDRAKTALKEPPKDLLQEATDLHHQIKEVQRLIHEGPVIQQTSADLPHMLDDETQEATVGELGEVEPADKRMRTAEDAEALVGFLRRVRASAASGEEF